MVKLTKGDRMSAVWDNLSRRLAVSAALFMRRLASDE